MKLLFYLMLLGSPASAQICFYPNLNFSHQFQACNTGINQQRVPNAVTWKMNRNKWITGSLVFLAGATKGFNETLTFHWKIFERTFPGANPRWFNPDVSWRNKYKNGNPNNGPRYPLSTSLLVIGTDQYHLNNFIGRTSWIAAITIKFREPKKSWKYYVKDFLYYAVCNQLGFALTYYPFRYNRFHRQ